MEKIQIKRSKDADTRSASQGVTKEQLLANTKSHISDVQNVGNWIAEAFKTQLSQHDYTKTEFIDEFYNDFSEVLKDKNKSFKDMKWFKERHITERHHLNDRVPDDVDLIDVLEMVIDCTCAGLARSGDVYPIEIDPEILKKAINNTKDLIIANTEVID